MDILFLSVGRQQAIQSLLDVRYIHLTLALKTYLGLCNRAWRNDIRGHSARTVFDGHGIRQRVDSGFRNTDMGLERRSAVMESSANEDDTSTGSDGRVLYY